MAQDRTSGFDMLVQVSEAELNLQLATAFLAGRIFPSATRLPVNVGGVTGTADLNFATPVADLDRPRPQLGLRVPFIGSQLQVSAPVNATIAPLGGTITIVDNIQMITVGAAQLATLNFANGVAAVTVEFDAPSQALLAPLLAAAGLNLTQAQNLMAGAVLQQLQTSIGRIDLTPPIPVVDDTNPLTPFNIAVTTINDTSTADRDCIAFGIRMSNDAGGNINGVTASLIPAGSTALVMVSNFWLLARVLRPRVAAALGRPVSDFDTPLRLNRAVPAPGGTGTLTSLEARVVANRIRVDGRATASGTGWSARSEFSFFIDLAVSSGTITITATTPVVSTDVDLAWWVWLASLGLGGLFGGIIGAVIAAIVLAVVEALAGSLVDGLIRGGLTGGLTGLPAIPLGPIGSGLTLVSLILDDLELRGGIVRSVNVPVRNHGHHRSAGRFAVDLDHGTVTATERPGTDLVWEPATSLRFTGTARASITGSAYQALTPLQISQLPLTTTNIPATLIPAALDLGWLFDHPELVVGVRTTEGRYAKCRAWRSPLQQDLHLEWTTYDNPIPTLDIIAHWSVTERGDTNEYITPQCEHCQSHQVAWHGEIEAWPKLMTFPIDYQWCLCGTIIHEGDGELTTPDGTITYTLHDRYLTVCTELGADLDCELCVSAIDATGRELFTCTQLTQAGTQTRCQKCEPAPYTLEILPAAEHLAAWRPLLSPAPARH